MDWDTWSRTTLIKNARIVAVLSAEGGAVVEQLPVVEFIEGRRPELNSGHDGNANQAGLGHFSSFGVPNVPAPDASELTESKIIIDGECDLGPIEIRGLGHFGYDDNGNVEGWFDEVPTILLDRLPEAEGSTDEDYSVEAWREHMENVRPKPSAQYERASRGRDRDEWG